MPKIVTTATKGLVQSTGAGFKQLDFMLGYEDNLTATANEISDAEARAASIGTPTAAQIAAATLTANALNTTAYAGATGAAAVYLPAANAGTHVALKFTADPSDANDILVHASHATYQSASEAARQNAGGTAAVFRAVRVSGAGTSAGLNHGISDDADKKMTIDVHASNCSHSQNGVYHFYCIEDGAWIVAVFGPQKGTGSTLAFS